MKTNTLDFDAQALRERILDLAMRGKLVPQDPNDEPASVLLEKIKAEKEELVKEKKIKKSKPLPAITDDEKPFNIPDSWEWVRFSELFNIEGGSQPPKSTFSDTGGKGKIRLFQIRDYGENPVPVYIPIDKAKKISQIGDILLARYGASLGKVFFAEYGAYNVALAKVLFNFKSEDFILKKYLFYYFKSELYQNFVRSNSRSAQAGFNKSDLNRLVFPVPPISEQKRIAAKIAQLFALLRKVESSTQQYAELQTLLKSKVLNLAMRGKLVKQDPNDEPASVLLEKIKGEKAELTKEKKIKKSKPLPPITDEEKPFDIPDSWEWVRLESVCDEIGDIDHKMPRKTINGQYLYISPKDFTKNGIDYDHAKRISEDDFKKLSQKFLPKKGDLIFPRYGTIGIIRKINTERPVLVSYSCCLIRSNKNMSNDFIQYELKSKITKKEIDKYVNRSTQPNVGLKSIKSFLFPLPPLEEQKRIVSKIIELFSLL
ncbi:restriction endonuclease subunit S [Lactobacillus amylovorus]|uniref:restriction endonuclease subunit S n=1 Tax=Lactobacillus amylovorus TaxID=1604 RepID=UPI000E470967|nr:restriction endonuclease subunit S [Lactobacillus amylovorus]RGW80757.1 restriction endonuclease subunit S [Lactobacillus amylovorus]